MPGMIPDAALAFYITHCYILTCRATPPDGKHSNRLNTRNQQTMTNTYTSEGRTALKAAITNSPAWGDYKDAHGVTSGRLTVAGLEKAAAALGIDARQYAKDVFAPATPPVAAPVAAPVEVEAAPVVEVEAAPVETQDGETADAIARDILSGSIADMAARVETLAARALDAETAAAETSARLAAAMAAPGSNVVAMPTPAAPVAKAPTVAPARVVETKTRKDVFGLTLDGSDFPVSIWNAADAPARDKKMAWDKTVLSYALAVWRRGKNIWLHGPRGVGKTTFCEQVAAWTGRPHVRIGFHADMEPVHLFGMVVPEPTGGVVWQDGVLVAAMRRPGTIILLDEPTLAPVGMLHALQTVLDTRRVTLETGEVVEAAEGVVFAIADNTAGHGDDTGEYHGTGPMNAAFLDRAAVSIPVGYLPKAKEVALVEARTGLNRATADKLVTFAGLTRQKGNDCAGLSPRRVFAWAELVADGFPSAEAFNMAVVNLADPAHVEIYRQLEIGDGVGGLDHAVIDALARGEALPSPDGAAPQSTDDVETRLGFDALDLDNVNA